MADMDLAREPAAPDRGPLRSARSSIGHPITADTLVFGTAETVRLFRRPAAI